MVAISSSRNSHSLARRLGFSCAVPLTRCLSPSASALPRHSSPILRWNRGIHCGSLTRSHHSLSSTLPPSRSLVLIRTLTRAPPPPPPTGFVHLPQTSCHGLMRPFHLCPPESCKPLTADSPRSLPPPPPPSIPTHVPRAPPARTLHVPFTYFAHTLHTRLTYLAHTLRTLPREEAIRRGRERRAIRRGRERRAIRRGRERRAIRRG